MTEPVTGLADLLAAFRDLPDKMRGKAIRNALAAGARLVRDAAKQAAPVLSSRDSRRKPGTVRDAIRVRTSKRDRAAGDVGVFVNVRPNVKGANSPDDPFYWRWIEFGRRASMTKRVTRDARGRRRVTMVRVGPIAAGQSLERGADQFPAALARIEAGFGREVARLNKRRPDQA